MRARWRARALAIASRTRRERAGERGRAVVLRQRTVPHDSLVTNVGVGGGVGECCYQAAHIAHQKAAGFVWLEEHLVRIDSDGVRVLDSFEKLASFCTEDSKAAEGGIDVEPDLLLGADFGDRAQWID